MELEIIEREEQALMDREEITVEISHAGEATPSAAAVRDQIAAELDLDPKTVEIAAIRSSTGLSTSTGTVRVHEEPVHEELPEEAEEDGEPEDEEAGEPAEEEADEEESGGDAEESGEAAEEMEEEEEAADEEDGEDDGDADEEDPEEEEDGEGTEEKDGDA
ncbi:MAG: hypothetical protein SVY41_03110 [Candidatus Nanohaloarchaea archaeon]|nr:hypothetical protein [Candidatus Nanohaloarchaea archaeon]